MDRAEIFSPPAEEAWREPGARNARTSFGFQHEVLSMKKILTSLALVACFSLAGCHTCDVCDDCGDGGCIAGKGMHNAPCHTCGSSPVVAPAPVQMAPAPMPGPGR